MRSRFTRTNVPASENQRPDSGRTPEAHGTQPARETPSDVSQMTAQVYCVEDSAQQPTQEGNGGRSLGPSEGMEGQGPRGASQEGNRGRLLVLSEGTEGQGPREASQEGNGGRLLGPSEGTEGQGPRGASQEGNGGRILGPSEGTEEQGPRGASRKTPSLAASFGSSEVFCGVSDERQLALELIESFLAESATPSTRIDVPRGLCPACLLREGSTSTLESDLPSPLVRELEPRISHEVSEALHPPPAGTSGSRKFTQKAKPRKECKGTHTDVPVAELIGAQVAGTSTQQQSPESVCVSGTAPQTVPAGEDSEANARMSEEEEKEAEIQARSRDPETVETGANRTVDGQKQESADESPEPDPFWFW